MTDKQPEALRLADAIDERKCTYGDVDAAADELRRLHQSEREAWRYADELEQERKRLHEVNAELVEAFEQLMNDIDNGVIEVKTMQNANAALAKAQGDNNG